LSRQVAIKLLRSRFSDDAETLRQRLARGTLDLSKAADFALRLANGLAAAHQKGIVTI